MINEDLNTPARTKKICIVATVPFVLHVFMREHVEKLSEHYDVTLVAKCTEQEVQAMLNKNVRFIPLPIEQEISLIDDLRALLLLYRLFRKHRFDCVHSLMPKSGLLSMMAAFAARVPNRIHIFTGQVWFTEKGLFKLLLKSLDRVLAFCATHLLTDSPSQRKFLIDQGIVRADKIQVLGNGSISGVDTERFKFDPVQRARIRAEYGIADTDFVFLFIARLTRVKGIVDLAHAFKDLAANTPNTHLFVIGPDEDGVEPELERILSTCRDRVHRVEYSDRPEDYMSAADAFSLPSYREGFSLATIQAAGVGLPAVASRIYGLTDAVEENVTGLLHEPGAIGEIRDAMRKIYDDLGLRAQMAEAARSRAYEKFSQKKIIEEMQRFYKMLLKS